MFSFSFPVKATIAISLFASLLLLSACSEQNTQSTPVAKQKVTPPKIDRATPVAFTSAIATTQTTTLHPILTVYKSPTCGCCEKWIDHIEQHGFTTKAHNHENLSAFKQAKGIAPQYRSCHTAVSKDGYVFEGHVPAKFIHQFLAQPPKNALGLSVPAMPIGTPGMEIGDKFMPYQVILLNADGSYGIYAELNNYQEQF
ncbi:hypothetical protein CMT41_17390 [Colwellia sp. MT41]|uniref:DUF411 domain-containing protein n=1 Tax=Colwellia sp. MT41 TaxID=58049 RepID=UPI0007178A0A|nr:hypothetical protein CMT41_17390 [Colwellia sp. MT41]